MAEVIDQQQQEQQQQQQELEQIHRGTPAAVTEVRRQLVECGIDDDASILHLASSEAELRTVAPEVLGPNFGNEAWFALVHVWRASSFQGRRWVDAQCVRLAAPPTPRPPAECEQPPSADAPSGAADDFFAVGFSDGG